MRKTQMRLELKRILKTVENVELQSVEIGKKIVHEIEKYSTICVYLNMEKEVHTEYILKRLFQGNKNVFVPRVTGKSSQDMVMLKCTSMQDIDTFEKSHWGIPEPPLHRKNVLDMDHVDAVVVPGVAFDKDCNRLGHGKGYYDCFLEKVARRQTQPPVTLGVGLNEQMVDCIPMSTHDIPLDVVVTPKDVYRRMM